MTLPRYYSRLAPFQDFLLSGRAILTYHHVGPRPRRVRLKGLYVSPPLFLRQVSELKAAGFSSPAYHDVNRYVPGEARVFFSFDDGFADVLQHALPVLAQHKFYAIEFLIADLLGKKSEWQEFSGDVAGQLMDRDQVMEWLAAGNEIGSHTLTHPHLTEIPPERAREEIVSSKKKLEDTFNRRVDHFCYPYGDWNPMIRDLVAEAGYRTACITRFGVNSPAEDPLLLKRITARYPSRNWKSFWQWCKSWFR